MFVAIFISFFACGRWFYLAGSFWVLAADEGKAARQDGKAARQDGKAARQDCEPSRGERRINGREDFEIPFNKIQRALHSWQQHFQVESRPGQVCGTCPR